MAIMKKETAAQVAAMLAVLALAGAVAAPPPPPKGQEVHLFEATVRVPGGGVDADEYNYRLLAAVLGSVEAARSAMYETYPGTFSAFLTNNQARRLSKVPGVLGVKQREYSTGGQ